LNSKDRNVLKEKTVWGWATWKRLGVGSLRLFVLRKKRGKRAPIGEKNLYKRRRPDIETTPRKRRGGNGTPLTTQGRRPRSQRTSFAMPSINATKVRGSMESGKKRHSADTSALLW